MNPERRSKEEAPEPDNSRHPADGLAQGQLVGSEDCDRLAGKPTVNERCSSNTGDVIDGHGTNWAVAHADQRKNREGIQRVAEVIEHVVAAAIDDPGLENRVLQTRRSNDFLGRVLGLVIAGAAFRSCPQEAQEQDPPNACRLGRLDNMSSAINVDGAIRLAAQLPVDPGAMRDGITSCKRRGQRREIINASANPA